MSNEDFRGSLAITGDPDADRLVNTDPTALLLAMLLDQQISLELAFVGPMRLHGRLGHLEPALIAQMEPEQLLEAVSTKPALHRFPKAMSQRIHDLMRYLDDHLDGDATKLWTDASSGDALASGLRALPGFGVEKTQITVAVLAKRFGIAPVGWEAAAGVFSDSEPRSAADAYDAESMAAVRAWKRTQRAAGLDKQGRPRAAG